MCPREKQKFGLLRPNAESPAKTDIIARVIYSLLARRCCYVETKFGQRPRPVSAKKLGQRLGLGRHRSVARAIKLLAESGLIEKQGLGWIANPPQDDMFHGRRAGKAATASHHWYHSLAFDKVYIGPGLTLKMSLAVCFVVSKPDQSARSIARLLSIDDKTVGKAKQWVTTNIRNVQSEAKTSGEIDLDKVCKAAAAKLEYVFVGDSELEAEQIEATLARLAEKALAAGLDKFSIRSVVSGLVKDCEAKDPAQWRWTPEFLTHIVSTHLDEILSRIWEAPGVWTGLNYFRLGNHYGPFVLEFPLYVLHGKQFMVFRRTGERKRYFFVQYEAKIPIYSFGDDLWRKVDPYGGYFKTPDSTAIWDIVLTQPLDIRDAVIKPVEHPKCIPGKCNGTTVKTNRRVLKEIQVRSSKAGCNGMRTTLSFSIASEMLLG